jgi:hypothetical protein
VGYFAGVLERVVALEHTCQFLDERVRLGPMGLHVSKIIRCFALALVLENPVHDLGGLHLYHGYRLVKFESFSVLDVFLF